MYFSCATHNNHCVMKIMFKAAGATYVKGTRVTTCFQKESGGVPKHKSETGLAQSHEYINNLENYQRGCVKIFIQGSGVLFPCWGLW